MSNDIVAIPTNLALPARLQQPGIAAQIAADNAAAAGGIKTGGFARISIDANKFSIVDGGETQPLTTPGAPGQPALPMMCLEVVVVLANPSLSKTYYAKKWVKGSADEPDCRSANGQAPDPDVAQKQHTNCAACPQNQWGSKISELSGKEIKACGDSKQLALLPANDLAYKALGLAVKAGSLSNWGKYIQALSGRGYPITELVTNVTFDATQNGVLNFGFNRFLSDDEAAKVKARAAGDDVKNIVSPSRTIAAPALAAPVAAPALAAPVEPVVATPTVFAPSPVQQAPVFAQPEQPPVMNTGFGAAPAPAAPAPEVPAAEPKRKRAPRQPTAPATGTADQRIAHLSPEFQAAIAAGGGADSVIGQALLAQFPAPAPASQVGVVNTAPLVQAPPPPVAAAPAPAAPINVGGFGGAPAATPTPASAATPAGASAAMSLKDILQAKLGIKPGVNGAAHHAVG